MISKNDQTQSIISTRSDLLELILIAICLSLGVNFMASGLLILFNQTWINTFLVGFLIVFVGIITLFARAIPKFSRHVSLNGVLCFSKSREVISVPGYKFLEETDKNVRALTVENKALGKIWSENDFSVRDGNVLNISQSGKLLVEAIEYFIINKLSMHLNYELESSDNKSIINKSELIKLGRKDIPSVLLENRFLELFSKPMEEREAFSEHQDSEESKKRGETVYVWTPNGPFFRKFNLVLPKGTKIYRVDRSSIIIQTNRFSMRITVEFPRFTAVLPRHFERLYLGSSILDVHSRHVKIKIETKFKMRSFFSIKGWEYFRWSDSFIDEITKDFSFDEFIDHIGWYNAVTISRIMHQRTAGNNDSNKLPEKSTYSIKKNNFSINVEALNSNLNK